MRTETLYFSCHVMLMPTQRGRLLGEKNDCNYIESLDRERGEEVKDSEGESARGGCVLLNILHIGFTVTRHVKLS